MAWSLPEGLYTYFSHKDLHVQERVDIQATITESKLMEFNQSKLAFLEDLLKTDGYISYTERPGCRYGLSIEWQDRRKLDLFMSSELYQFFHGAIITLGNLESVTVKSNRS